MDLLPRIKGMYRLLELFTEQGSGGVVDKIIISQDSVSDLVNELFPGAYSSLTKVRTNSRSMQRVLTVDYRSTSNRSTKLFFNLLVYTAVLTRWQTSSRSLVPSMPKRQLFTLALSGTV